jgi:hypothetical protein
MGSNSPSARPTGAYLARSKDLLRPDITFRRPIDRHRIEAAAAEGLQLSHGVTALFQGLGTQAQDGPGR